jgi:hypothetical protein
MVKTICEDCDFIDDGPIICDRKDWQEKIVHVRE